MLNNKLVLSIVAVGVVAFIGCATATQTYSEEEIGLRKSNLYQEKNVALKDKVDFSKANPGESKVYERSFENAPPLISHSVEGMLPITKDNNMCLSCHAPEVAKLVNAPSTPKTHLASYRPVIGFQNGLLTKNGKKYENTADVKTVAHARNGVSSDRFNCSQCHVPQTDNEPLVKNEFNPEFRDSKTKSSSDLYKLMDEGVTYRKLK